MKKLLVLLLTIPLLLTAADTVDIYWIDVEGGASTLIVTQAGETILMDAGYPGNNDRDAKRVHGVLTRQAKMNKIDYFITSHFHGDHVGGLAALAKLVPIGAFLDHGESVDAASERGKPLWDSYLAVAADKRRVVKPGETLPLKGVNLTILAADNDTIVQPVANGGIANSLCDNFEIRPEDKGENGKSVGYLLRVGEFDFLNLGDLSWNYQYQLACPKNMIGEVDLFQVTHHSGDDLLPQQVWSAKPTAAVLNNGPRKGGHPEAFETLSASPGLEDLWQLHRAMGSDDAHNTEERLTANLTETDDCKGGFIHAALHSDGSYTLTNSRNGYSKTYRSK